MIFLAISDQDGFGSKILDAASPADAAEQIRQRYAASGASFGASTTIGILLPQFTAAVTPGNPPAVVFNGDSSTQRTIRNAAQAALTNNQAYLGLGNPTTAQAVAQVAALTRQVNGLIRFLVGDFSAAT